MEHDSATVREGTSAFHNEGVVAHIKGWCRVVASARSLFCSLRLQNS